MARNSISCTSIMFRCLVLAHDVHNETLMVSRRKDAIRWITDLRARDC
jgi:hypothetical protein